MEIDKKKFYEMKIGDETFLGPYGLIRVPGGWVLSAVQWAVFIPYYNDFQIEKKVLP